MDDFSEDDFSEDEGTMPQTTASSTSSPPAAPAAPPPPPPLAPSGPPPPLSNSAPPPAPALNAFFGVVKGAMRENAKADPKTLSPSRPRTDTAGAKARALNRSKYKYKADHSTAKERSFSASNPAEIGQAKAGKSRAISAFNSNPSMGESNPSRAPEHRRSSGGGHMIELQKQHLRGIFAAACTEHTHGEMLLSQENLREAVSMTGLVPSKTLLEQFLPGNKKTVDLAKFLSVVLENLEYEEEVMKDVVMNDLIGLFEMFDTAGEGEMDIKTIRHLMMEVLTSDKSELSRAEFDEFLEYAGLQGGEVIDYKKLANNLMLSKPEQKMVVE